MCFCIEVQWCFGWLIVIADVFIILNIGCYQYFLKTVLAAGFKHIYISIFKNYLGINPAQAGAADAEGKVVVSVGAFRHIMLQLIFSVLKYKQHNRLVLPGKPVVWLTIRN